MDGMIMKIFPSFNEALKSCGKGYSDEYLVNCVVEKNRIYRDNLNTIGFILPKRFLQVYFSVLMVSPKDKISVLDFGGGGGTNYFLMRKYLGDNINITWHVVETPALAAKASDILSTDSLKFFDSIEKAQENIEFDLILAIGSLHFIEYPLIALKQLLNIKTPYFYFCHTPLTFNSKSIVCIQNSLLSDNGPGPLPEGYDDCIIQYPYTILNGPYFLKTINKLYKTDLLHEDMPIRREDMIFNTYGGLFSLK